MNICQFELIIPTGACNRTETNLLWKIELQHKNKVKKYWSTFSLAQFFSVFFPATCTTGKCVSVGKYVLLIYINMFTLDSYQHSQYSRMTQDELTSTQSHSDLESAHHGYTTILNTHMHAIISTHTDTCYHRYNLLKVYHKYTQWHPKTSRI